MVRAILVPGPVRDRLTRGVFIPSDPTEPVALLERTFMNAARADTVWKAMRAGERTGQIERGYGAPYYAAAVAAGLIDAGEETFILEHEQAMRAIIDVDDFAPGQLSPRTGRSAFVASEARQG